MAKDTETRRRGDAEMEALRREIDGLRAQVAAAQARAAAGGDLLSIPAAELPADYHGHMPRQVLVSLRPELRRRVMSLYLHLKAEHATTRHPRYHDQTKHVDNPSHVITWLLERVRLVGESDDAK